MTWIWSLPVGVLAKGDAALMVELDGGLDSGRDSKYVVGIALSSKSKYRSDDVY
jgi:hypothetical protein